MDKKSISYGKWLPNWDGPYVEKVFLNKGYAIREVNSNNYIGSVNEKYIQHYKPNITKIKTPTT